ncbi:MAG: hypothetical protein M3Q49_03735, partial [Actinomycetota bacterium]|nr:hypothetical protein [Actinomycetota bacterium]
DELVGYKYHYMRPEEDFYVRYDMGEEERPDHPKRHVQASSVGKDFRLPTGEVRCEEVLEMICEQFVV